MSGNPYSPPTTAVADVGHGVPIARPRVVTAGTRGLGAAMVLDFAVAANGMRLVARFLPRGESMTAFYVAALGFQAAYVLAVFALLAAAGRGRNWGRISLTTLLALNFARYSWSARAVFEAPDILTGGAVYLLAPALPLLTASLLFLPRANAWYAALRARRG